jgi:hypothetical protein
LRGLSFNGVDSGIVGIRPTGTNTSTSAVIVENCVIDGNFSGTARGISDERSGGGELHVINSTIRNNGATGIAIISNVKASLSNVRVQNSNIGLAISGTAQAMASDSVFSGNTASGVEADNTSTVLLDRSVISGNATGITANGTVQISNSDIAFNNTAAAGANLQSFINNRVINNANLGPINTIGNPSGPFGLK